MDENFQDEKLIASPQAADLLPSGSEQKIPVRVANSQAPENNFPRLFKTSAPLVEKNMPAQRPSDAFLQSIQNEKPSAPKSFPSFIKNEPVPSTVTMPRPGKFMTFLRAAGKFLLLSVLVVVVFVVALYIIGGIMLLLRK